MWRRIRPPLAVVALALLGLIVLLAVLQYRWLGQISDAERAQRRTTLAAGALEFAQDFDREITRAYLLFQTDTPIDAAGRRCGAREPVRGALRSVAGDRALPAPHEGALRVLAGSDGSAVLRHFDPSTRRLEPVEWPEAMSDWREQLTPGTWKDSSSAGNNFFIRRLPAPIWESAPALVVPTPIIIFGKPKAASRMAAAMSFSILMIDRDYVSRELLPSLAERHFGHPAAQGGPGLDFKVAVVSRAAPDTFVFQSTPSFAPALDAQADATADSFRCGRRISAARRRGPPFLGVRDRAGPAVRRNRAVRRHRNDPVAAPVDHDSARPRRWPGRVPGPSPRRRPPRRG